MNNKPLTITLFFTHGISLKNWFEMGLLDREIELYNRLIEKFNVKVQFFTYGDHSDLRFKDKLGKIKLFPVYERLKKPSIKLLVFFQTLIIPWVYRDIIKKSDIIKSNQLIGAWVPVVIKIFFQKPVIIRCGYEFYKNYLSLNGKNFNSLFFRLISKIIYYFSTHIWLSSYEASKFIQKVFKVSSSKITVLPNWINTQKFCPKDRQKKKNTILFVGRFHKEKNLKLLLESLIGLNQTLDVIGFGSPNSEIIEIIKINGLDVNFLGSFSNDKMPEIYNNYSIYIICSRYEGNPKTLLEAMSCGLSVIGTNVSGIREVIDHKKNGFLVKSDPQSLKKALIELISNKNFATELGLKARQSIVEKNSIEKYTETEYLLYKSLLK